YRRRRRRRGRAVTNEVFQIVMAEWETRQPDPGSGLDGVSLQTREVQATASRLADSGLLAVTALRTGLLIESISHVGKIALRHRETTLHALPENRRLSTEPDSLRRAGPSRKHRQRPPPTARVKAARCPIRGERFTTATERRGPWPELS